MARHEQCRQEQYLCWIKEKTTESNPGSGRALRSSCSSTTAECRGEQGTCRKAGYQLIDTMLQNALCLCEGIYNPAITAAKLILISLQCMPAPGVFLFPNSDFKRKGG